MQVLQSEKLASIGQLAAGVAHEINNPIGYVSANLGSLKRYLDDLMKVLDAHLELAAELPTECREGGGADRRDRCRLPARGFAAAARRELRGGWSGCAGSCST